jgi:predicted dienelactone hydrolase
MARMRPLEILIVVLLALHLVWPPARPAAIRYLPVVAVLAVFMHLAIEGYRWQMLPLYILAGTLAVTGLLRAGSGRDLSVAASYLTLGLVAVSTALPILLPVPRLAKAGGPLQVGTTILTLTDDSRREIYSGEDEPRRFMIQVWYPAEPDRQDAAAPWMQRADVFGPAISEFLHFPPFFLDHLALVKTSAYADAPLAPSSSGYPVIIFSHGWNGFAAQNSSQAIELASRGYVVVAIQHAYGAVTTVFDDGTIAPNNPAALPDGAPEDVYDAAARTLVEQWAGDISFALDTLDQLDRTPGTQFYTALDMQHVGIYGHSTGGGAAIQFCGTDERCVAVLALDPFMTPVSLEVLEAGDPQPAFFMFSQSWRDEVDSKNNRLFAGFYVHVPQSLGVVSVAGSKHHDFSDLPLLSPISAQLGFKGPIDGARMIEIADAYIIAFFDATLKGRKTDLFDGPSTIFPEVRFE